MRDSKRNWKTVILFVFLLGLLPLSLDSYLSIMPLLEQVFKKDPIFIQMGFSAFLFIFGLFQLFFGVLSDRFGRKGMALNGLIVFEIGVICSFFATQLTVLLLGRILQAMGCSMIFVAVLAAVKDSYSYQKSTIIYTYMTAWNPLFALFGLVMSSFLIKWIGWQSVFIVLGLFGFFLFYLSCLYFKETLIQKNKDFFWSRARFNQLKNPCFIIFTLTLVSGYSGLMSIISLTPHILLKVLDVKLQYLGLYFGILSSSVLFSGISSVYIIKKQGVFFLLKTGFILLLLATILLLIINVSYTLSCWSYFLPTSLMVIGSVWLLNAGQGGSMSMCKASNAGFTTSILSLFRYGLGSILCAIPVFISSTSIMPLAYLCFILLSIMSCALWVLHYFYHDAKLALKVL
ncbi:MAG: multidrug effflux MFS transporter [Endozoicomonadaceae bacterium]|nr:multidrug effflux MFS transporter [Endozoicomonadaceae bacterium]